MADLKELRPDKERGVQHSSSRRDRQADTMAMAVSAQLVNLSTKAELQLIEAVANAMPSGQVRTSNSGENYVL